MPLTLPQYPDLPAMRCDDGCGMCCGPVPMNEAEQDAIAAYIVEHGITPRKQGITCPLHIDGRCSVYPVRPMLCRLYGHCAGMTCPKGYNVNIPVRDERRVLDRYKPTIRMPLQFSTMGFAWTDAELFDMAMAEVLEGEANSERIR